MPAATIFTVNSAADVAGVSGDTVCETDPGNGICTLRAAIMAANHIPAGGATIIIPAGIFTLTIAPVGTDDETTGDLNVTQDMNIQGAGAARTFIDASGLVPGDRVLHIIGANLTLSEVTIQHGSLVDDNGAGIRLDDNASKVHASLTLNDSSVSDNTITVHAIVGTGAGIVGNSGVITINRSSISNNLILINPTATGGVAGAGSGISIDAGSLTLTQSAVNANTIDSPLLSLTNAGFAIYSLVNATIDKSTINGNIDNYGVGAVFIELGSMTILNSTVSNNVSGTGGGGIVNVGNLILINSTLSGNTTNGNGGGLYNCGSSSCTTSLYNMTLTSNTAGTAKTGGGIYSEPGGIIHFQNTIVSSNRAHSFSGIPPFLPSDCSGALISAGYNLVGTASGCTISGQTSGDQVGVSPDLGSLQDNGGPNQTQALLPGSPAIGAGNPSGCTDELGTTLITDQRGAPRRVDRGGLMRCDIGAYQTQLMTFLPFLRK